MLQRKKLKTQKYIVLSYSLPNDDKKSYLSDRGILIKSAKVRQGLFLSCQIVNQLLTMHARKNIFILF